MNLLKNYYIIIIKIKNYFKYYIFSNYTKKNLIKSYNMKNKYFYFKLFDFYTNFFKLS